MQRRKILWMGEAGAGLLLGLAIGWCVNMVGISENLADKVSFKVSRTHRSMHHPHPHAPYTPTHTHTHAHPATHLSQTLPRLQASFFLLVLMPAIMFHAGYTLDVVPFVHNIGSIFMTAFLGTTISTFTVGFMM